MKKIIYHKTAQKDIRQFPKEVRFRIAAMLDMLQEGLSLQPKDFKYMGSVGEGVYELRIRMKTQYRVLYVTKFKKAIYILHGFVKKTQKTNQHDIEIGRKRYRELMITLGGKND